MNLLLVLLLAALTFFFVNEGLIFLAFVTLVLLVLAALGGSTPRREPAYAHAGGSGGPDVILEQEEPDIPSNIDIKVKPNWEANTLFEDMFAADGEMIDTLGRSVARFASGGKYGKPRKQATDEPEW